MKNFVKLMADYCSTGLWNKSGSNIEHESIPISLNLKQRINSWQAQFDIHDNESDDKSRHLDYVVFSKNGFDIATAIKHELGNNFEVWYFDEYKFNLPNTQRVDYFYEIL